MKKLVYLTTKEKEEKIKRQRVVIENENWEFNDEELEPLYQYNIIKTQPQESIMYKRMLQQINRKIHGYKSQDKEKELYNEVEFIQLNSIIKLFNDCQCKCFYCNQCVYILYKHVREPKQWTLERINNEIGHNEGNVKIACLECNLRRRTMYHERFVFTKQLQIIKKDI